MPLYAELLRCVMGLLTRGARGFPLCPAGHVSLNPGEIAPWFALGSTLQRIGADEVSEELDVELCLISRP
jgi:hypothetical protein